MKKLTIIISIIILTATSTLVVYATKNTKHNDSRVIASGDNFVITSESFEKHKYYIDIAFEIQNEQIEASSFTSDEKASLYNSIKTQRSSDEEMLETMVVTELITTICNERGYKISLDDAKFEVEKSFAITQEIIDNGNAQEVEQALKSQAAYNSFLDRINMSNEEYLLEVASKSMQQLMYRDFYYGEFCKSNAEVTDVKLLKEMYEAHLDDLLGNSAVTISLD